MKPANLSTSPRQATKHIPFGAQAALARAVGIGHVHMSQLLSGRRNAGLVFGLKLAMATGAVITIWGRGGDIQARRAAVEAWAWGR